MILKAGAQALLQAVRQRYQCKDCQARFDDLTDTIFAGHHQPLGVWILCLYLMGLNLSNQQIAQELELNKDDSQQMTSQLRSSIVENKSEVILEQGGRVATDTVDERYKTQVKSNKVVDNLTY